jgi:hypothetical protein
MLTVPGKIKFNDPVILNPRTKALANAAATILFTVPVANNEWVGGTVIGFAAVANGTEVLCESHQFNYAAVNKAGVLTMTVTESGTATANTSAATPTATPSLVDEGSGSGIMDVKILVSSTLATPTTIQYQYVVFPMRGTVTFV